MNKLVITGNGFDLAHGLKTSYNDFLQYLWKEIFNCTDNPKLDTLVKYHVNHEFQSTLKDCTSIENAKDLLMQEPKILQASIDKNMHLSIRTNNGITTIVQCYSFLFAQINASLIKGWTDLEQVYYDILKNILFSRNNSLKKTKGLNIAYHREKCEIKDGLGILNEDFQTIVELFEQYLTKVVNCKVEKKKPYNFSKQINNFYDSELLKNINYKSNNPNYYSSLQKEILVNADGNFLRDFNTSDFDSLRNDGNRVGEILFLDFNYTSNVENYVGIINCSSKEFRYDAKHIQIHGKLNDKENPINFGFGDEMDEDYKLLENINNNDILKNIKSFKYLSNSNYRELLEWINGTEFQVCIMGHSCGLSDRTMLNTIFEHDNCLSIKTFYHKKDDGMDDYNNIVMNISRHFDDKKMMRAKVVNKSLCSPLPQTHHYQ